MIKKSNWMLAPLVMLAMVANGADIARPANWKKMEVDQQVDWLLSQMTLEEKMDQLHIQPRQKVKGLGRRSQPWNERVGIPPLLCGNGPRGPRSSGPIPKENRVVKNANRGATSPIALCFASTWNSDIAYAAGRQWGMLTKEYGLNTLYAPGVNIVKDPRAGRNAEYAGEDPFHTGKIGAGITKGLQSVGVAACAKHFIVNNWETGRTSYDVQVPPRPLRETYLTAFRMCVEEGNVWGMMTAYNSANGQWCSANKVAMTDIARNEWGYDGFFVSDWGAASDTADVMLKAGMNLELPGNKRMRHDMLKDALEHGKITEKDIDARVGELLRVKLKYLNYYGGNTPSGYDRKAFEKMMFNAAVEGAVLLKNKNEMLPLSPKQSIALIGPFAADENETVGNNGSSTVRPDYVVTLEQALKERDINVGFEKGCGTAAYDGAKYTQKFPCEVELFNGLALEGEPVAVQKMPKVTLATVRSESKEKGCDGVAGLGFRTSGADVKKIGPISDSSAWTMAIWINLVDQFPDGFIMDLGDKIHKHAHKTHSIEVKGNSFEVQEPGKKKKKKAVDWRDMNQRWIPVAVTYANNKVKLYRDGELLSEIDTDGDLSGLSLYLGGSKNNTHPLGMDADDFRVWDRALSAREIQQVANRKFGAVAKADRIEDFENPQEALGAVPGLKDKKNMSARFTGMFTPEKAGKVAFKIDCNGGTRVWIDGKRVTNLWDRKGGRGRYMKFWHVFENTKPHKMVIEVASMTRGKEPFVKMEYTKPAPDGQFDAACALAKKSDVAVLCVGVSAVGQQGEGRDRATFMLPSWQDELIAAVQKVNSKTVVLLFTAGGVDVSRWQEKADAIMEVYYMGSESGNAISALLYGEANPSGKLTITWPIKETDLAYSGPETNYRDTVNEFGYRYFDANNIPVQYPFGYGLSYTTFKFKKVTSAKSDDKFYPVTAKVTLANSGKVTGKEVVQVYVTDPKSSVEQAKKELAGFAKVELKPGESKTVDVPLHWTAFEFFDVKPGKWTREPGEFIIRAGGSSASLSVEDKIKL